MKKIFYSCLLAIAGIAAWILIYAIPEMWESLSAFALVVASALAIYASFQVQYPDDLEDLEDEI